MDREMLLRHLSNTDRHIAEGEKHLVAQETIVQQLVSAGADVTQATQVLRVLKETQLAHLQNRERILSELNDLNNP